MLVDRFHRVHNYLRISITDRCNLRCRYCMPADGIDLRPRDEILTFEEIELLAGIFVSLGVTKIRVTGGEPLVRKDVEVLCGRLARMQGLKTLAISTNGVLLQEKARALREAGVNNVNISLDTLRADRFGEVTLRSDFESVMRGIDAALQAGFTSVKINTVVMRGVNDDELLDFVGFAVDRCLQVRFIEYMPFLGNEWTEARCMPYAEMRHAIESACRLVPLTHDSSDGTAKEFAVGDTNTVVGFITTMSEHFCSSCSRLRLTADGKLRNCLFASGEIDLRALLRSGAGRDAIVHAIDTSLQLKWEKHPGPEQLLADQNRAMIAIGG